MNSATSIVEAFEKCVADSSYDAVSVDEICSTAHVSRRTFYRYFSGKQAVFERIIDTHLIDPIFGMHDLAFADRLDLPTSLTYNRSMMAILDKKDFFKKTLNGEHLELVSYYFHRLLSLHAGSFDSPTMCEAEKAFAAYSTTCASIGSIMHWLEQDCDITPEQFANYGMRWIFARPRELDVGKYGLD